MKKLSTVILLVGIMLGLFSCKSEEVLPIVNSDVFVITKKVDGVVMHGLGLHTYANVTMNGVVAEDEMGESYILRAYNNYTLEYYTETDSEDYSTDLPESGLYTFSVALNNGEILTVSDDLEGTYIEPVNFTTCEYDPNNNRINVVWEASNEEDYSVLILRNSQGAMVYYSNTLGTSVVSGSITTSGWSGDYAPVAGETYTVELGMYVRESDESSLLEAKAVTTQDVVWGE